MTPAAGTNADLGPFLRRVPLFAGLNDATLDLLARVSRVRRLPQGYVLFQQDDPAEAAYLVRTGAISIMVSAPDGRELVINEMHPGDCFGELALLTGAPRSAGAVAREASEVIVMPRREFLDELEDDPKLLRHLMETLAQRLLASTERESALAFLDAPSRVARLLLHLAGGRAEPCDIIISQEELAQRIGVTRQTAARILGDWRRHGWVRTARERITIINCSALAQLAG